MNAATPDHVTISLLPDGRPLVTSVGMVFTVAEDGYDSPVRVDVDTPIPDGDEAGALDELLGSAFELIHLGTGLPLTAADFPEEGSPSSITPLHVVLGFTPDAHLRGQATFHYQRVHHALGARRLETTAVLSEPDLKTLDAILAPKLLEAIASKDCELAPEAVPAGGTEP